MDNNNENNRLTMDIDDFFRYLYKCLGFGIVCFVLYQLYIVASSAGVVIVFGVLVVIALQLLNNKKISIKPDDIKATVNSDENRTIFTNLIKKIF